MSPHPLTLIHTESEPTERLVIKIGKVESTLAPVHKFSNITREIHCSIVLNGCDGHFLDSFHREIDIEPIMSIIDVTVKVDFIHLSVFTTRVVHHHYVVIFKVLTHKLLIEGLRSIFFHAYDFVLAVATCPFKTNRRL